MLREVSLGSSEFSPKGVLFSISCVGSKDFKMLWVAKTVMFASFKVHQ